MKTNRHTKNRFTLTLFFLFSTACCNTNASLNILPESIDDSRYRLSGYIEQGKWLALNIRGTPCPPCREELPELVHFHDGHKDSDAIVVGIAIDFPGFKYAKKDEVIAFADDYLIDYPAVLSDSGITESLGLGRLEGLPATYLFNPAGKVAGIQLGGIPKKILEVFINNEKLKTPNSSNR